MIFSKKQNTTQTKPLSSALRLRARSAPERLPHLAKGLGDATVSRLASMERFVGSGGKRGGCSGERMVFVQVETVKLVLIFFV